MVSSVRRSLVSAFITVCFGAAVMGWGMAPSCPGTASSAHHHPASSSHGPQPGHGHGPVSQACAVHLCCVHLATGAATTLAPVGMAFGPAHGGFAPIPAPANPRPEYSLPFAQAPPPVTA